MNRKIKPGEKKLAFAMYDSYLTKKGIFEVQKADPNDPRLKGLLHPERIVFGEEIKPLPGYWTKTMEQIVTTSEIEYEFCYGESRVFIITEEEKNQIINEIDEIIRRNQAEKEARIAKEIAEIRKKQKAALEEAKRTGREVKVRVISCYDEDPSGDERGVRVLAEYATPDGRIVKKAYHTY
jgi:hypothetical protein